MAKPILQDEVVDITNNETEVKEYIYKFYPEQKQNQDNKWTIHNKVILNANGVEELEKKIVDFVKRFEAGEKLEAILPNLNLADDLKERFKKVVKIAIKDSWAEACIEEYKKAIAEKRKANYPAFPKIDEE